MLPDKNKGRKGQYVSRHCSSDIILYQSTGSSMIQRVSQIGACSGTALSPNSWHHRLLIQKLKQGFRRPWKMPWFMQMAPPSFDSYSGVTGGQGLVPRCPWTALDKQDQIGHYPWFYLVSSRTASSCLSKSKCRFGWQGIKLTRRLNTAWREDQANERTKAAT